MFDLFEKTFQPRSFGQDCGTGSGAVPLVLYFYFIISIQFQTNPAPQRPANFHHAIQVVMLTFRIRGSAATQSPRPLMGKSRLFPEKPLVVPRCSCFSAFLACGHLPCRTRQAAWWRKGRPGNALNFGRRILSRRRMTKAAPRGAATTQRRAPQIPHRRNAIGQRLGFNE